VLLRFGQMTVERLDQFAVRRRVGQLRNRLRQALFSIVQAAQFFHEERAKVINGSRLFSNVASASPGPSPPNAEINRFKTQVGKIRE